MADLQLHGIGKRFGDVQAVRGLTLDIASGEFIVLLGPSGAGKTTTLRLVAGLERPDAGTVHIGGHDVTALAPALRDVTFVFQQYSLYPHLNVYDNLAFPLRSPMRRTPDEVRRKVTEGADACASTTSWRTQPPSSPAARCNASRSAARWCVSPRSR
jgi:multiple sugar transport system ATP-binding protein